VGSVERVPRPSRIPPLTPRTLLTGAAACAGLFALILALAYGSPRATYLDAAAYLGFLDLQRPVLNELMHRFATLGNPAEVALIGTALAAVALARARPRVAAAVLALVFVTSVSSQLLKALLAYPRFGGEIDGAHVAAEAFPSGHSTAAMALAICCVMVAPRRLRPLAAFVGVGLALAVSFSVVGLGGHLPSDVAGGYLLAAFWGLVIAAGLQWSNERWPERTVRSRTLVAVRRAADAVAAVGLVAVAVGGVAFVGLAALAVLLTQPGDVIDYARYHTSVLVVAPALIALAVALLAAMTVVLRRRA
jgi:membrane-associated phospholipid phosphatase